MVCAGKNVNGWHWEEKDRMEWSRARLGELLGGLDAGLDAGSVGSLRIERVKDVTGDVSGRPCTSTACTACTST